MDSATAQRPDDAEPARLTADLVRRGGNPWWGATPPEESRPDTAPALAAAPEDAPAAARRLPRRRLAPDDLPPNRTGLSLRVDDTLWRDLAVFGAVFGAATAVMLALALAA